MHIFIKYNYPSYKNEPRLNLFYKDLTVTQKNVVLIGLSLAFKIVRTKIFCVICILLNTVLEVFLRVSWTTTVITESIETCW